jgi:integrase/recombinase XerC/integrase/recombinase XerD
VIFLSSLTSATEKEYHKASPLNTNQRTLQNSIDSFLLDRKAAGLAKRSISFYALNLKQFTAYCDSQPIQTIESITPDTLRQYLLSLQDGHNAGGIHAAFRLLRTFFNFLAFDEVMPPEWKNPIKRLHAPKNVLPPLQPISYDDINALLNVSMGRDYCLWLFLLDSGLRASELVSLDITDINFNIGVVTVRKTKNGRQRVVFIGERTKRALKAYLRSRRDDCPALFVTTDSYRLTYSGLHEVLRRRMKDSGIKGAQLHGFRRAFALGMLRGGCDIFSLQRILGHSDIGIMRRYLAQDDSDSRLAHIKSSPVKEL